MLQLGFDAEYLVESRCQIIFYNNFDLIIFGMLPEQGRRGIQDLVNPNNVILIL